MLDFDLADCGLEGAFIVTRPDGGLRYAVICKSLPQKILASLKLAAQLGETVRIQTKEGLYVLDQVTIEPLASGAVRLAGRIKERSEGR